jgi:Secretion system C-terminal sorting domain
MNCPTDKNQSIYTVIILGESKMNKYSFCIRTVLFIIALGATALAATKTWVPTAGGAWTTPANWSPSGAPATGDDVTILSDQSANITTMPSIALNSLTINGTCLLAAATTGNTLTITTSMLVAAGKTLTLGAANARVVFTLNGTATINGNLAFDAGTTPRNFTVNSGATLIINSGGRVYDPILSAGSVFILNSGATLEIANTGGLSTGTTADATVAINFGGSYSYSTGASYIYDGSTAQVTGNGLPATVNNLTINDANVVALSKATTVTGILNLQAGVLNNSTYSITAGAIEYNGGSLSSPVPVEMTSFTATSQKTIALLAWSTATEVNNYGFNIERRAIASSTWATLGFVVGNGTSNATHNYTYIDNNLSAGTCVYRLKQIDNNGAFKYSQSVELEVHLAPATIGLNQNYPNPFNPSTKISFALANTEYARLVVYNLLGQRVETLFDGIADGQKEYIIAFDASQLAGGIYFYKIQTATRTDVRRMLLVK